MLRCLVASASLAALSVLCFAAAQSQEKPKTAIIQLASTPPDYSKEGIIYEQVATVYTYQADGTGDKTLTVKASVQTDNGVRQAGVLAFSYASGNEHLDVAYVRVRKPDGTLIATPSADQQDMPTEVTRQAPFYSDIREVQIPVKSLSPGDKLEYQIRWIEQKPGTPDRFWGAANFVTGVVVRSETFELSYPKEKYALILSPKNKPEIADEGSRRVYRWASSQLKPTVISDNAKKAAEVDADALPDITWTTYRDWQEVGQWYGALARQRAEPGPEVTAKAKQLIAGKTTDQEKIEAIYSYVSTQVRYIGVSFGIGRYQPHAADTVLENQYGDCKDKHTLLAALLKAAGYEAWPALIGSSRALHPELPSPAQFDHVITVVSLGGKQIWLDSTPEIAPYGMLIATLRDKQALVIPETGEAKLTRTPADGPFPFVDTYTATATLDDQGTLQGHLDFELRGDNEVIFRSIYHTTPRAQWQQLAQNVSQNLGYAGTVSNLDVSLPERTSEPFHYAYDYNRKVYADWPNRRILPLSLSVSLTSPGEDEIPPNKPYNIGSRHTETQHSVIALPPGYSATLPRSVKYTTSFAIYQADYKLEGGKLITDRRLELLTHEIPFEQIDELTKFAKNVTDDQGQFIQLTGSGAASDKPTAASTDAEQLVQSAVQKIQQTDLKAARADLESAAKLDPHQRGLWAAYAFLDDQEHHRDASVDDLKKEIQFHPENIAVYRALAQTQATLKQSDQAEQTLRSLLKEAPGDSGAEQELGRLLLNDKQYGEAATVLEQAAKSSPENGALAVQAARAEILAGHRDLGIAALGRVLTEATDPLALNNASYELADHDADLPSAEAGCKRALDKLEKKSAQMVLGNLDKSDLANTRLLVATWDTMGWIYFKEGNLPMAERYIAASWKSSQHDDVGEHLRVIYEKEGKKNDANAIASTDLQKARTFDLPLKWKDGSAEFFFLLSPGKVDDVRFVHDNDNFQGALTDLRLDGLRGQVPEGSSGRILRRGVLFCSKMIHTCQLVLVPLGTTTLD